MDKNWRHSLSDRMKDYEEPAPEGLWEEISESPEFARLISTGDAGTGKPAVSGSRRLWFSLAGGMAAVFALFLLLLKPDSPVPELVAEIPSPYSSDFVDRTVQAGNDQIVTGNDKIAAKNDRDEAMNDGMATGNPSMVTENGKVAPVNDRVVTESDSRVAETEPSVVTPEQEPSIGIPSVGEESVTGHSDPLAKSVTGHSALDAESHSDTEDVQEHSSSLGDAFAEIPSPYSSDFSDCTVQAGKDSQDWDETIEIIENSRERGRWSAGLLASNIPGSSSSSRAGDISFAGMAASGAADFVSSSLADIRTFNTTRETSTSYKHYQPIKVGLSVRYHITRNWSAESGLTYSYLYSKVRSGSEDYYADGVQTLHYIGIPLNFNFSIWSNPSLTLYASAGGLMEKCVGGKLRTTSILKRTKGDTDYTDIMVKPLQWSVSASIGLQYNLSHLLGIYLEPGAAYYFNNGSPVETFYSNHPFNFNLELGLRFSF